MLTLLTTTGARPVAFAICERLMFRQDYSGPVTWIVVDDGPAPQALCECPPSWRRIVHRPDPLWRPGENTQGRNLREGLAIARADARETGAPLKLVIIEDDDWYDPRWLSSVAEMLDGDAPLVGEGHARFYNVAYRRFGQYRNDAFSSLRSSAMRGGAIDLFEEVLSRPITLYDMALWKAAPLSALRFDALTIGMKAMPGRAGIAGGHDGLTGKPDRDARQLRAWIGPEDAAIYEPLTPVTEDGMMKLRAEKPFTYRTRALKAGDAFDATERHGRYLVRTGRARLRTDDPPPPPPSSPPPSEAGGGGRQNDADKTVLPTRRRDEEKATRDDASAAVKDKDKTDAPPAAPVSKRKTTRKSARRNSTAASASPESVKGGADT